MPVSRNQLLRLQRAAFEELWRRGELVRLLWPHQVPMYHKFREQIKARSIRPFVCNAARRHGKTAVMLIIVMEECLRRRRFRARWTSDTDDTILESVRPTFDALVADCPDDIRPEWVGNSIRFKNGSRCVMASGHTIKACNAQRGAASQLSVVDEGGTMDHLDYLVRSILLAQHAHSRGALFLISTPSLTKDHPYFEFYQAAKLAGRFCEYTIDDNTSLDDGAKQELIEEVGGIYGKESSMVQRELYCKFVSDEERAIVPEWDPEPVAPGATRSPSGLIGYFPKEDKYLRFYHRYEGMDLGVKDMTVYLQGYYDFLNATLYVTSESWLQGGKVTTDAIEAMIRKARHDNWDGTPELLKLWGQAQPYLSVMDNDLRLRNDLAKKGFSFSTVEKDRLHVMVNQLKNLIGQRRLVVDPSCAMLLGCLEGGMWDKEKKKFAKSKTFGHYDALAALIYMAISINYTKNPIPPDLGLDPTLMWIPETETFENPNSMAARLARQLERI